MEAWETNTLPSAWVEVFLFMLLVKMDTEVFIRTEPWCPIWRGNFYLAGDTREGRSFVPEGLAHFCSAREGSGLLVTLSAMCLCSRSLKKFKNLCIPPVVIFLSPSRTQGRPLSVEWKRHWSIPSWLAGPVEAGSSPAAQSSVQDPEIEDGAHVCRQIAHLRE